MLKLRIVATVCRSSGGSNSLAILMGSCNSRSRAMLSKGTCPDQCIYDVVTVSGYSGYGCLTPLPLFRTNPAVAKSAG